MTAKEKAEELTNIFLESLYDNGSLSFKRILYPKAKQCALIAVDEILEAIEKVFVPLTSKINSTYRYYQEVKQEIEKL